jgi:hypothetical protein
LSSNDDPDNSICFQDETILDSNNQSNNLVSKQLVFPSNSSNPHLNEKSNQAEEVEEVEVPNLLRMMADVIILYYILL